MVPFVISMLWMYVATVSAAEVADATGGESCKTTPCNDATKSQCTEKGEGVYKTVECVACEEDAHCEHIEGGLSVCSTEGVCKAPPKVVADESDLCKKTPCNDAAKSQCTEVYEEVKCVPCKEDAHCEHIEKGLSVCSKEGVCEAPPERKCTEDKECPATMPMCKNKDGSVSTEEPDVKKDDDTITGEGATGEGGYDTATTKPQPEKICKPCEIHADCDRLAKDDHGVTRHFCYEGACKRCDAKTLSANNNTDAVTHCNLLKTDAACGEEDFFMCGAEHACRAKVVEVTTKEPGYAATNATTPEPVVVYGGDDDDARRLAEGEAPKDTEGEATKDTEEEATKDTEEEAAKDSGTKYCMKTKPLGSSNVKTDFTDCTCQLGTFPTAGKKADDGGFPIWIIIVAVAAVALIIIIVVIVVVSTKKGKDVNESPPATNFQPTSSGSGTSNRGASKEYPRGAVVSSSRGHDGGASSRGNNARRLKDPSKKPAVQSSTSTRATPSSSRGHSAFR